MSWNPLAQPIDFIVLAGKKSPGIATVEGASTPRKWDAQQGYGMSGAIARYTGDELSEFSVKLKLVSEQDWVDWDAWKPLVAKSPVGVRPKALEIWHPFLEELGIKSVVIKNQKQPVMEDPGVFIIEIVFLQFRKPKASYAKPDGAKTTAIDPVDQKIDGLNSQLQKLIK